MVSSWSCATVGKTRDISQITLAQGSTTSQRQLSGELGTAGVVAGRGAGGSAGLTFVLEVGLGVVGLAAGVFVVGAGGLGDRGRAGAGGCNGIDWPAGNGSAAGGATGGEGTC